MINPIGFYREDRCIKCSKERSVECYDYNGRPIGFSRTIDLINLGRPLKIRGISYMKCTSCGTRFTPQWDNIKDIPRPMGYSINLDIFMKNFGGK